MHFFNPPPLMRLLEVIAAEQTGERALAVARATGEAMGKHVIVARDGPGFLVNRCGRPFGGEALRLLQEGVATHEQIDRIVRLGGGFRMGPFELMDLVGIDVGLRGREVVRRAVVRRAALEAAARSRRARSPPGELGRKTGPRLVRLRGRRAAPPRRPARARAGRRRRRAASRSTASGALAARAARARARRRASTPAPPEDFGGAEEPELVVDASVPAPVSDIGAAGRRPAARDAVRRPRRWPARDPTACGFHLLPPLGDVDARRADAPAHARPTPTRASRPRASSRRCGFHAEWVGDAPGPRARPDRLPARQRGGVRGRRGRRVGRRRRRRPDARPEPPARPGRVGRARSASTTCWRRSTACGTTCATRATGPRAAARGGREWPQPT